MVRKEPSSGGREKVKKRKKIEKKPFAGSTVERNADMLVDMAADGDFRAVEKMCKEGRALNYRHSFLGYGALQAAADHGHMRVIRILLKYGADPNVTRLKPNDTALHWAAANGRADVVQLLLEHGGDRHIENSAGKIPLDLAHEYYKEDCADLLRDPPITPESPRLLTTTVDSASISWCVPPDNGVVTDGYEIKWVPVSGSGVIEKKAEGGTILPKFKPGEMPTVPKEYMSYTFAGLFTDTCYEISVRAKNAKGWSEYSPAVVAKTGPSRPTPPGAPILVHCTAIAITLEWPASMPHGDRIQGYELQWRTMSNGATHNNRSSKWEEGEIDGFVETAARENQAFKEGDEVDVRLSRDAEWLPASILEVTGPNYVVRYETGKRESGIDSSCIRLKGGMSAAARRGLEAKCAILLPSTAYTFRVRSHNSFGFSEWSETSISITTLDAPVVSNLTPWSFDMSWDPAPGVDMYELHWSEATIEEYERGRAEKEREWAVLSDDLESVSFAVDWASYAIRPRKYYVFRVRFHLEERNEWTSWEDSEVSAVVCTPDDVPDIMMQPKLAEEGCFPRDMDIFWSPSICNGPEIDEYEVQWHRVAEDCADVDEWGDLWGQVVLPGLATAFHVEDLHPGVNVTYRIRAHNTLGWSDWSVGKEVVRTKDDVPTAPELPLLVKKKSVGTPGRSWVTLSWFTPFCNGQPIDAYRVEWSEERKGDEGTATATAKGKGKGGGEGEKGEKEEEDDGEEWTIGESKVSHERFKGGNVTATVLGFFPGRKYRYRVRAHNSVGWSVCSPATEFFRMPETEPDALLRPPIAADVAATATTLTWDAAVDSGCPVEKYGLQWRLLQSEKWEKAALTDYVEALRCEATALPLLPGSTYIFRVRSWNKWGWSAYSPDSDPVRNLERPPQPPVLTLLGATSDTIQVQWSPPYNNGQPIEAYDVQWSMGGRGAWHRAYTKDDHRPYFHNPETNESRWRLEGEGIWRDGDWVNPGRSVYLGVDDRNSCYNGRGTFLREVPDKVLPKGSQVSTPYGSAVVVSEPEVRPDKDPDGAVSGIYTVAFHWGSKGYLSRKSLTELHHAPKDPGHLHLAREIHRPQITRHLEQHTRETEAFVKREDVDFEKEINPPPTEAELDYGLWVEVWMDGTLYILNENTKELREAPKDWNLGKAAETPRSRWVRIFDTFTGRPYYHNTATKKTSWRPPLEDYDEQWEIERDFKTNDLSSIIPPPPLHFTGTRWRSHEDSISFHNETLTLNVGGLKPGRFYRFRARSRSALGWGEPGQLTGFTRTLDGVPEVIPHVDIILSTSRSATLQWSLPRSNMMHGHVTGYEVQRRDVRSEWRERLSLSVLNLQPAFWDDDDYEPPEVIPWSTKEWTTIECDIKEDVYKNTCRGLTSDGIIPCTHMEFRVRAKNELGFGKWSKASRTVQIPPEVPAKPVNFHVKLMADTYLYYAWDLPPNHGREIDYYQMQMRSVDLEVPHRSSEWKTVLDGERITEMEKDVFDLLPTLDYQFRLRAHNFCGWSEWTVDAVQRADRRF